MTYVAHDQSTRLATIQGEPKSEATNSWPYFCQILTDLHKFFLGKFAVNWLLKPPYFLHMLPHYLVKKLMSENERLMIDYKVV